MTAFWLAEGSNPKHPIRRYGSCQGDNHCFRAMPCLERFGLLCIHQYNVVGVLGSGVNQSINTQYPPPLFLDVFIR